MAIVIKIGVYNDGGRESVNVFIYQGNIMRRTDWDGYIGIAEKDPSFVVEAYEEAEYECVEDMPEAIANLYKINIPAGYVAGGGEVYEVFDKAWQYLCNGAPKTPSFKALMLCNVGESTKSFDPYARMVYVYHPDVGLRVMDCMSYLNLIEKNHKEDYKRGTAALSNLCNALVIADFRWMKSHITDPNRFYNDDTTRMVFRSLWFAATGEELVI